MKLQLTRSKTIEIRMPWERTASAAVSSSTGPADVVGVAIGDNDPRGCPAVRLQRRKDGVHVVAVGFVPAPGELPGSWEEKRDSGFWSLPPAFQAPQAALAVFSSQMFARQTTRDALTPEKKNPPVPSAEPSAGRRKLGIRRNATAETKNGDTAKPSTAVSVVVPDPYVPVSQDGIRFVMAPLAEEPFVLQSGLPEFQAIWLAGLLPEGKRPTACSLQVAPTAILSAIRDQPAFREADGTCVVVFVLHASIWFAAYREGELILFRECPGAIGTDVMHELVKTSLGVDDAEVDAFLEEHLVDPTPALEPLMRPVVQQLQLSLNYLAQRYDVHVDQVLLMGLPSGADFWSQFAQESIGVTFVSPNLFDGVKLPPKKTDAILGGLTAAASQQFLAAFGAARAAMEGRA